MLAYTGDVACVSGALHYRVLNLPLGPALYGPNNKASPARHVKIHQLLPLMTCQEPLEHRAEGCTNEERIKI